MFTGSGERDIDNLGKGMIQLTTPVQLELQNINLKQT